MARKPPWIDLRAPWMDLRIPHQRETPHPGPMSPYRRVWTDGDPVWIQVCDGSRVGRSTSKTSTSTSMESGYFSIPGKVDEVSGPPFTPLKDRLEEFDRITDTEETIDTDKLTASHHLCNDDEHSEKDLEKDLPVFDEPPLAADVMAGGDVKSLCDVTRLCIAD